MGECAYYLKAAFKSPAEAKKAAGKIERFLKQVKEAHEFYQEGSPRKDFWVEFEERFPTVMEYVKTLPGYKLQPELFILSGKLDVGTDESNECLCLGNVVAWGDACVWHMAEWGPLALFIKEKFGAIKVVTDNEENGCCSLGALQLYDYESIVTDILKNKALLPLLIGVNKDLDELVEPRLRKR